MLVKFTTSLTGNVIIKPGEIVDLPDAEAKRHIAANNAIAADDIDTAVYQAREAAKAKRREKAAVAAKETAAIKASERATVSAPAKASK